MKKLLANIASVALAGALCFGFSACDGAKVNAEKEAKNLVGTEVTAEQWTAAMAVFAKEDAKYTVNFSASLTFVYEDLQAKATQTANGQITIDGESMHCVVDHLTSVLETDDAQAAEEMTYNGFGNAEKSNKEYFYEKEKDHQWLAYEKNSKGAWEKYQASDDFPESLLEHSRPYLEYLIFHNSVVFKDAAIRASNVSDETFYEIFSYSEKKNGYCDVSPMMEYSTTDMIFKFDQEGKLAAFVLETKENAPYTFAFYCTIDYTEREVTLPKVTEET